MNVPRYVVVQKIRGVTPLEAISAWKAEHPEFAGIPASYAGRLDPMAEGKLLVLLGDECKRQPFYTKLDKEYEVEVVLDLKTDTGDVLGLARYTLAKQSAISLAVRSALAQEIGSHSRRYPAFSSKTVNGKPLFLYALEGMLDSITIPEHIETIYRIKHIATEHVSSSELHKRINTALSVVPRSDEPSKELGNDFRQDEIRTRWNNLFKEISQPEFTIIRLRVVCGSGTYMRTLAEHIGRSLGTNAFALSINRTRLGAFVPLGLFSFWRKSY